MKRIATALILAFVATACTGATDAVVPPTPSTSAAPSVTPPPAAFEYVAAVKGDWGSGTDKQRLVTNQMCSVRLQVPFDDVITTGDNFYSPDGTATARTFLEPERCLQGVTWRAVWGNHDVNGNSTRTTLGAQKWYAWSAGGIRFIALDSNSTWDRGQRRFLERELAGTNDPKVVVFHHPPFTGGLHPPNDLVRREWVSLFEKYRVSLVLNGHNHDYEHHRVNGIDYVITGGGGEAVYPCLRRPASMIRCDQVYHFLLLGVNDTSITVRAISGTGPILDEFQIAL